MFPFWRNNKATLFFGFAGLGKALLDNYWVFNLPLAGTKGSDTTEKAFYLIGELVVNSILGGALGRVIDDASETWKIHKGTVLTGLAGTAKALMDNYFLFTNLPLVGAEESDVTAKVFYMIAQVLVNGSLGAGLGYLTDKPRVIEAPQEELLESYQYQARQPSL